jgi:lambda family phage tail tape measure protein
MSGQIGSLVVSLEASVTKFSSDMAMASSIAQQRMAQIDKAAGIVKTSLSALGAGLVVGLTFEKLKGQIEGTIQAAAGLQEMAEKTGATAERLSGLAAVAKLSGTDADALATGLQKLSKSMVDAQNGGAKSTEAFRAMGISVDQLKGKKPDEAFLLIANRLNLYADGADKTALAQAILGKSGANLLAVMKDLGIVGDLQVKTTKEQIEMAHQYEQNLIRVEAAQKAVFKVVAFEMLPVMDAFEKALLDWITNTDGIKKAADGLAKDHAIREFAAEGIKALSILIDGLDGIARTAMIVTTSVSGLSRVWAAFKEGGKDNAALGEKIQADTFKNIKDILMKPLFSNTLEKQLANMDLDTYHRGAGFADPRSLGATPEAETAGYRQSLKFNPNAGTSTDDPAKLALEGQIKAGEQYIAAFQKQLATQESYLDDFHRMEYIGDKDYYATKLQLIADETAAVLAQYDKDIAAARAYENTSAKTAKERQFAENQIKELINKRTAAEVEGSKRQVDANLAAIAVIKQFSLATEAVAHQHDLENAAMRFNLDLMGKGALEVQRLTAAKTLDLALEARLYDLRRKGGDEDKMQAEISAAITENERQKLAVADLVTTAYDKQRDALFGAGEALRKYSEDASNAGQQVGTVIADSLKGLEDMIVSFATTGKLSWTSLEQTILSGITRIIVQEQLIKPLADYLQGGMSSGTGGGGMLGGFLKMIGMGGGGAVNMGSGAASSIDAASSTFAGWYADGGYIPPGQWGMAGEEGPEPVFGGHGGVTVHPAASADGRSGAGMTWAPVINITVPNNTTRNTAGQIAVEVRRALAQAGRHS